MSSNVTNHLQNLPDKNPETVEKDVRKWVESICEFKANLEMEKCELPNKKAPKKIRKYKVKKKLSAHNVRGEESKQPAKREQKVVKPKPAHKKEIAKDKPAKDNEHPSVTSVFDNLRDHFKSVKIPLNWVSGQSRRRIVFCRVKVTSHGSQYEMVSDRGVAITSDCMVHVFVDGPEVILNNWKKQKVETIEDIRKIVKAVDGFKICSGALPSGLKNPNCLIFLNGESKTCQACKSDISHLKVSGKKVRANPKTVEKTSSLQK